MKLDRERVCMHVCEGKNMRKKCAAVKILNPLDEIIIIKEKKKKKQKVK